MPKALFLDRDGTLILDKHYLADPAGVELIPGVAEALRRARALGYRLFIHTNQSGIARGYFSAADLDAMHRYLAGKLARWGVGLAGVYYCPHHPEGSVPALAVECECRKPRPGMLLRAAAELGLDLRRSWFVGDILDDVEAGNRAGCRTILVDLGSEAVPASPLRRPDFVARDTIHALQIIAAAESLRPLVELDYRPNRWELVTR